MNTKTSTKINHEYIRSQSDDVKRMIRAIRRQLDVDYLRDVAEHGADAGFPGFTYYTDTVKFYNRHEGAIWELLREDADALGYDNVPALIASFNSAHQAEDPTTFKNLLTWYALETVARNMTDF
jgi:hypothetical protein